MRTSRFAFASAVVVAITASAATLASAQDTTSSSFINVGTYAIAVPFGDTHRFVSPMSWFGAGWEGQWRFHQHFAKGLSGSLQDFADMEGGTTTFPSGAVTGNQAREILMVTAMGTGRWYAGNTWGRGLYLGLGAGGEVDEQYYQVGVTPQLTRSAFHLVLAPEIGVITPVMDGADLVISARFMVPTNSGSYVGGGSRSFQYMVLSFGMAER